MMHTGDKIRKIRELMDIKQETMAQLLGLSRPAYGNIERGETKISKERLAQIAEILKTTSEFILAFGESPTNFFDQCSGFVGVNSQNKQTNHYGQQELEHQLEKTKLENEKLRLEAEKYRLERDNAVLEAQIGQLKNQASTG